jgi:hypothetical protein
MMGCDIHSLVLVTRNDESAYVWCSDPNIDRDYLLFSLMADVRTRDDGAAGVFRFQPRGFPYGTPPGVVCEYNSDAAYHSASWLTAGELDAVLDRYVTLEETPAAGALVDMHALVAALHALDVDDTRAVLVFWFDN